MKWLRRSAVAKIPLAEIALAAQYEQAPDHNLAAAYEWYLRAAQDGNGVAQLRIAQMCQSGQGTMKDDAQANAWYLKAANKALPGRNPISPIVIRPERALKKTMRKPLSECRKPPPPEWRKRRKILDSLILPGKA